MTTMMKCVLAAMAIAICGGVSMLGNLMSLSEGAYADGVSTDDEMAAVVVFDKAYKAPVGVGITPTKATPEAIAELEAAADEAEEAVDEVEEVIDEEETIVDYEEDDYGAYDAGSGGAWYEDGHYDANLSGAWYDGASFAYDGTYNDASGFSFTYYSERVLPGGGLEIPGRHVGDEGYVCDENGYVCLAADNFPKGTVVSIPFGCGTGVVYDCGSGDGNIDVYVSW